MAGGTRICKVCGKEYPYCKTFRPTDSFRWQDVACCAEHGAEYFAQIEAARSGRVPKTEVQPVKKDDSLKSEKKSDKKSGKKIEDEKSEDFQPKED